MTLKKTVSILLALALIFQVFSISVFAENSSSGLVDQTQKVYTAIGDSTAVGYHPEYTNYKFNDISEYLEGADYICYPQELAKKIGYKMYNVGVVGIASQGLAKILSDSNATLANGEGAGSYIVCTQPNKDDKYWNAIKAADLITLNVGSNDLLKTKLTSEFMSIVFSLTASMKQSGSQSALNGELVQKIVKLLFDSYQKDAYTDVVNAYKTNYATIFKRVRELNGNAQLVLVGCYNPFSKDNLDQRVKDAIADGTLWARLGGDLDAFKTMMQALISTLKPSEQKAASDALDAELAEMNRIANVEKTVAGEITDAQAINTLVNDLVYVFVTAVFGDRIGDFIDEINEVVKGYAEKYAKDGVIYVDVPGCTVPINAMDMHPDDNGHKYIANQIYSAVKDVLPEENKNIISILYNFWKSLITGKFDFMSMLKELFNK